MTALGIQVLHKGSLLSSLHQSTWGPGTTGSEVSAHASLEAGFLMQTRDTGPSQAGARAFLLLQTQERMHCVWSVQYPLPACLGLQGFL